MNFKDKWIRFIYLFSWFSQIWYIFTMMISKKLEQCEIPKYKNKKEIQIALRGGDLYKRDNIGQAIKDYLIHPRVIQCRLEKKIPFGDCDDHAIYWCAALKKSNLVKRVWFSFFHMKGRGTDDTYSGHAVCVFQDKMNRLYWCDYSEPKFIEKIGDFQVNSAKLYGNEAVCGCLWEVIKVEKDDTPVFGAINRVLPGEDLKL